MKAAVVCLLSIVVAAGHESVCHLPLETGPCRARIIQWGSQDGQCTEFTYGGCQGNANRFG